MMMAVMVIVMIMMMINWIALKSKANGKTTGMDQTSQVPRPMLVGESDYDQTRWQISQQPTRHHPGLELQAWEQLRPTMAMFTLTILSSPWR